MWTSKHWLFNKNTFIDFENLSMEEYDDNISMAGWKSSMNAAVEL